MQPEARGAEPVVASGSNTSGGQGLHNYLLFVALHLIVLVLIYMFFTLQTELRGTINAQNLRAEQSAAEDGLRRRHREPDPGGPLTVAQGSLPRKRLITC